MNESRTKKIFICILASIGIPLLLYLGQLIGISLVLLVNAIAHLNMQSESTKIMDLLIMFIGPILSLIILYYLFKISKNSMVMKNSLKTKFSLLKFIEVILLASGITTFFIGLENFNSPITYAKPHINLYTILITIVSTTIFMPIVEEFFFRGALFEILRKRISNIHISIFIQALIFASIHSLNQGSPIAIVFQVICALISGMISGYILIETKSFYLCIIEHITFNLFGSFIIPLIMSSIYFNPYVYILIGTILIVLSQFDKILKFRK